MWRRKASEGHKAPVPGVGGKRRIEDGQETAFGEGVDFIPQQGKLQKNGKPEDCFFDSIVRLRMDDRTGCNRAYAKLSGSEADNLPAGAGKKVHRAPSQYNLE